MAAPRCEIPNCPNVGDELVDTDHGPRLLCLACIEQAGYPIEPPSRGELTFWTIVATVGLVGGIWLTAFGSVLLATEVELDARVMWIRWAMVAIGVATTWFCWRVLDAIATEAEAGR